MIFALSIPRVGVKAHFRWDVETLREHGILHQYIGDINHVWTTTGEAAWVKREDAKKVVLANGEYPSPPVEVGEELNKQSNPNHHLISYVIILAIPVPESWECRNQITQTSEVCILGEEFCICVIAHVMNHLTFQSFNL